MQDFIFKFKAIFHYNTKQHNRLSLDFIQINNKHTMDEENMCLNASFLQKFNNRRTSRNIAIFYCKYNIHPVLNR